MTDPIDDAQRALQTAIGTNETKLREQLGNEGYEVYIKRFNALEDLRLVDSNHHARQTKGWAEVALAKARFWRLVGSAVVAGAGLGIAWSVYEMVRWA